MNMARVRPSLVCDRIREQVSAGLDDELSQLERAMIDSHLERCMECREYDAGVSAVTAVLRTARLEQMTRPVAVRRQRHLAVRHRVQVAATAAAVAAIGLFAASHLSLSRPDSSYFNPAYVPSNTKIRYESPKQIQLEQAMIDRAEVGKPVDIRGLVL
jgi:predicted anti-sigma-YlaC factor YlaD